MTFRPFAAHAVRALLILCLPALALGADVKISALPTAGTVGATDVLPIVQGVCPSCSTYGASASQIEAYIQGALATVAHTGSASDLTSGTLPAARGGAGTLTGLLKANGSGTVSAATSGTDYAPATSGTSILKGNGAGGTVSASGGTDYLAPASNLSDVASVATSRANLKIDQLTTHGDSDYTIVSTDRIVATSATLTAARTWTLPSASALNAGEHLIVEDAAGGVTATNKITLARASSDTIDGATSLDVVTPYGLVDLISDGSSKWTYGVRGVSRGGTGATTARAAAQNLSTPYVLSQSYVASAHTGDTTETTLATVTIPAGAMGANGCIRVSSLWSATSSANTKTYRVYFGGTGGTKFLDLTETTTPAVRHRTEICNRNATNSQIGFSENSASGSGAAGSDRTSAIDTTASVTVVFRGTLTNTGETITLEGESVDVVYQP